ncbi:MAG: hypothetical protein CMM60_07710 [Rhodospirillaceae bacterium]|jgi:lipopolysaccharide export system protein LptC|nr:hypothetical protein [Rhodospirillaceae bacterium]|tara:strand:- start:5761 stop:6462 length:702 start_codon:yes stop_codon:yes gene_type:complete
MSTLETATGFPLPPQPTAPVRRRSAMENRARPKHLKWYSRFVQMTKFLLPTAALVLIGLVLAWPYLKTEDLKFRLSFAALTADKTEDPSMVNPRYVGFDKDNQAFSITADIAHKLTGESPNVELEMPKADITLDDGTWLVLTAETGLYRRTEKNLDLEGAVNLFHDSGYEFRTSRASIELEKGAARGSAPVHGQGPFGDLRGEGFYLIDKGKTIVFTGKSKLVIYPKGEKVLK